MDDIKFEDLQRAAPQQGDEQHTGNHKAPNAPDKGGADKFGGTRTGADNVETPKGAPTNIEKGTDVDRVAGVEDGREDARNPRGPTLRTAERDEHGRM
jgi:hypothetical protein